MISPINLANIFAKAADAVREHRLEMSRCGEPVRAPDQMKGPDFLSSICADADEPLVKRIAIAIAETYTVQRRTYTFRRRGSSHFYRN